MSRRFLLTVLVSLMVMVGVVVTPVAAAEQPVGDRIILLSSPAPSEFDADTPFHILHGWGVDAANNHPVGKWAFRLEIDGVDQGKGKLVSTTSGGVLTRLFLFNFPDGLPAGTYTLTGRWLGPCQEAVESGLYFGDCATPNEQVQVTIPFGEATITFS